MQKANWLVVLLGFMTVMSGGSSADDRAKDSVPAPKGYVCYRASAPIRIDGRIDDDAWKAAPWTDRFVDIQGDAPAASVPDASQDALG